MSISDETNESLAETAGWKLSRIEIPIPPGYEVTDFAAQLAADYQRMRSDPEYWAEFVRERDEWLLGVPICRDETDA